MLRMGEVCSDLGITSDRMRSLVTDFNTSCGYTGDDALVYTVRGSLLRLSPAIVKLMFSEDLAAINDEVTRMLRVASTTGAPVSVIIVAGGYAESPLLFSVRHSRQRSAPRSRACDLAPRDSTSPIAASSHRVQQG